MATRITHWRSKRLGAPLSRQVHAGHTATGNPVCRQRRPEVCSAAAACVGSAAAYLKTAIYAEGSNARCTYSVVA